MAETKQIQELTESIKLCASTNYDLSKYEAIERLSIVGSVFVSHILVGIVLFLFILFLSLSLGFFFSALVGTSYGGFGVIAAFYLLLGFVLLLSRKRFIEGPIRDRIICKVLNQN